MPGTKGDIREERVSRPLRIYDDEGAVCCLDGNIPGVLLDPVTARPLRIGTKSWQRAMERLHDLVAGE